MEATYRDRESPGTRARRGTGSLRERSPGVWEVRVVTGFDSARSRSIQRSFTVRGDAVLAERARRDLVAQYGATRAGVSYAAAAVTVGELLEDYLGSAQLWKPSAFAAVLAPCAWSVPAGRLRATIAARPPTLCGRTPNPRTVQSRPFCKPGARGATIPQDVENFLDGVPGPSRGEPSLSYYPRGGIEMCPGIPQTLDRRSLFSFGYPVGSRRRPVLLPRCF
jgi:hypothetical protein